MQRLLLRAALAAVSVRMGAADTPPLQAYPLLTLSPLVAIYSPCDTLFGCTTIAWGGYNRTLTGAVRVDDTTYVWMGDALRMGTSGTFHYPEQTRRDVTATSTRYTFVAGGVELNVSATTPLLATDYDLLSQPGTYWQVSIRVVDGRTHAVSLMLSHTAEAVIGDWSTPVVWSRSAINGLSALRLGATIQKPLVRVGDNRMLTWGYAYLLASDSPPDKGVNASSTSSLGGHVSRHLEIARSGGLPPDAPCPPGGGEAGHNPSNNSLSYPSAAKAWTWAQLSPADGAVSVTAFFAVDELFSLEYYGLSLQPYWRRTLPPNDTLTFPWGMLGGAWTRTGAALRAAAMFDAAYEASFLGVAGDDDGGALVAFGAAIYRQTMSQTVLVWHPERMAAWHVLREGAGGEQQQRQAAAGFVSLYFEYNEWIVCINPIVLVPPVL